MDARICRPFVVEFGAEEESRKYTRVEYITINFLCERLDPYLKEEKKYPF